MSSAIDAPRHVAKPTDHTAAQSNPVDDPEAVLNLLGDDYTRAVLQAIIAEPRSGNEVAAVADMSKATAFRRLNSLAEAGIVSVSQRLDLEGGNHHKVYSCALTEVTITISDQGFELSAQTQHSPSSGSASPVLAE